MARLDLDDVFDNVGALADVDPSAVRLTSPAEFQRVAQEVLQAEQVAPEEGQRLYRVQKPWRFNCDDAIRGDGFTERQFKLLVRNAMNGHAYQLSQRQPGHWALAGFQVRVTARQHLSGRTQRQTANMSPVELAAFVRDNKGKHTMLQDVRTYQELGIAMLFVETSGQPEMRYRNGRPVTDGQELPPELLRAMDALLKRDRAPEPAKDDTPPVDVAALQGTIAELTARLAALESDRAAAPALDAGPAPEPVEEWSPEPEPAPALAPAPASAAIDPAAALERLADMTDDEVADAFRATMGFRPGRRTRRTQEEAILRTAFPVEYAGE